jgi:hypothetical protein
MFAVVETGKGLDAETAVGIHTVMSLRPLFAQMLLPIISVFETRAIVGTLDMNRLF